MSTLDITTEEISAITQQALIGNRGFLESDIGFEHVARATRLVLFQSLNDELVRTAERWDAADAALQSLGLDPGVPQTVLDPVPADHLHEGPHESILKAPVEAFPNVSVTGYLSSPAGSQFDQFDTSSITMAIETYVAMGPVSVEHQSAFETMVHRKITRTTEAVARVVRASGTILGTVEPIQLPPVGGIASASWLRSKENGHGDGYLIQGSRLQYTMTRNHKPF